MAVALDASTPAAVYNDATTLTSLVTASFTPPSGSIIVAKVALADIGAPSASITISGSAVTFTSRINHVVSGHTPVMLATAVGGGAATTVTAAISGSGQPRGLVVSVWNGAQLAASPATHQLDQAASSAPSDTLTTVADGSVVDWIVGDWAAINGSTRTYRSSATELGYHFLTGQYTSYSAYQQAATAGSQTYGITAPTGQTPALASIEIQSSGGAVALPPILVMPPRR